MFSRVITFDCKKMRDYKKNNPKKYVDLKFIEERLPTTKIIYGDKLAILNFEKENSIGVLIKNKQIADSERKLFELVWKGLNNHQKPYKSNIYYSIYFID